MIIFCSLSSICSSIWRRFKRLARYSESSALSTGEVGDPVLNDFIVCLNDPSLYRNEAGVDSALFSNLDSYAGADGSTRTSPGTPSVVA